MTCRACRFDHPVHIRCEVAARQRTPKADAVGGTPNARSDSETVSGRRDRPPRTTDAASRRPVVNAVVNKDSHVVNASEGLVAGKLSLDGRSATAITSPAMGRQTAWQQANREKYNEKMQKYMKARRRKEAS